jgi:hypothetical protein
MPIESPPSGLHPLSAPNHSTEPIQLSVLNCSISLHTASPHALAALLAGYGAMVTTDRPADHALSYRIDETADGFTLVRTGGRAVAQDLAELLYLFDKDLTLELQRLRPELYFLHAGACERNGKIVICVAPSGSGKSTFVWALLHHGFHYLSDELAPVDLPTLAVQPYAHALCLKREPPTPYCLPLATLRTTDTLHVPVAALPGAGLSSGSATLGGVLFVDHRGSPSGPVLTSLKPATAAMHLFANALNPLAHANDGLDAAARIAQSVPCFALNSSDLPRACEAVVKLAAKL